MNEGRLNLLYIHSDQHNPRITGCYGDPLVRTPNLDALADTGVVLRNMYCPSPICVPSRMSTLTARHPFENEVWTNSHELSPAVPTLAHAMGASGYRPVLIGRMHAVGVDQLHGYAERFVGDHSPNHLGSAGVDHGDLSGTAGPARVSLMKSGHGQSAYQLHDQDVVTAAVDFLNREGAEKRSNPNAKPFSLTVGLMLPHQPFVAKREDYEYYFDRIEPPEIDEPFTDNLHPHIAEWRRLCGIQEVSREETRRARAAYWALVERMDVMIGEILHALRANNLEGETLIVYSSDHGEQVGEHGLWWKQTFYEDSVKVPAILSCPDRIPAGVTIDRVCSSLDLNATMLDALSCPVLPNSRGRTFVPLFRNSNLATWDDIAYSELCYDAAGRGGPFPENGVIQRMLRHGNWKLNYYHGQPFQLFHLGDDPRELVDRSGDPECAKIAADLHAKVLDGWNPNKIVNRLSELRFEQTLLSAWGRNVQPEERNRWDLRPEMDYLDPEQMK